MCMMPVAAFDVPVLLLPPFTKCRRKRWLWRSLIKTAQQNSKPSFVQPQPSLVKPQAGDGRTKRAADLSKPGQPRSMEAETTEGRRRVVPEREKRRKQRIDGRPTCRPTKPALTFPRTCTYRSVSNSNTKKVATERGRGNRCSSNGEEDRLGAPFVSSGTKCDLCQGALALSSEMRACNLYGRHRGA